VKSVVLTFALVLAAIFGPAFAQQSEYYLTGNFRELSGTVITDKGEQKTTFFGALGFQVVSGEKGLQLTLIELNLVSKGVLTSKGPTGTIGAILIDDDVTWYDSKTGQAQFRPVLSLHYQLIDQIKGFQTTAITKGENDQFIPFTEKLQGKMSARFPEALRAMEKGTTYMDLDVVFVLDVSVLGVISEIRLVGRVILDWSKFIAPALYLRIQPVFIGSGPTDPNRTGTAWSTLMSKATELWNRCGSVRCIKFVVNNPIYVNKPAYKVLDTTAEAESLRAEVDIVDAIEVFVVQRMAFVCDWGGGACFSSGTASAQVVTCDQQLAVPVPCPCPGFCPSTCPPCPPCQTGAVNFYHLAHELGHALNLYHPPHTSSTVGSNMEPSGFCCDNPNVQSAKNCRNASNPLLYWGIGVCLGRPDIAD